MACVLIYNSMIASKMTSCKFCKRLCIPLAFGNGNQMGSTTIAFHICQGDKLIANSKKYLAYQYLQIFECQAGVKVVCTLKHCFVMTDDPTTIHEFQHVIQNNHCKWSSTVHFISQAHKDIIFPNSTYQLLMEMSILLDATYFVGMFNSNVGLLVSLLHSCPCHLDVNFSIGNYSHLGQSYGAD